TLRPRDARERAHERDEAAWRAAARVEDGEIAVARVVEDDAGIPREVRACGAAGGAEVLAVDRLRTSLPGAEDVDDGRAGRRTRAPSVLASQPLGVTKKSASAPESNA